MENPPHQRLVRAGFTGDQIRQLFRLIDWLMDLPEELEKQLQQELTRFEEEKQMPYVTSIERFAEKRGKAEGKAEGMADTLLQILELRFTTAVPADLAAAVRAARDLAQAGRVGGRGLSGQLAGGVPPPGPTLSLHATTSQTARPRAARNASTVRPNSCRSADEPG